MECSCGRKAEVTLGYEKRGFCESCFVRFFERKVLNRLRGSLPRESKVGFDMSKRGGIVAKHVIEPFALKARNECFSLPSKKKPEIVILGDSLDDEAVRIMREAIEGKHCDGGIKPLARCLDSEIEAYARITGLELPERDKRSELDEAIREELGLIESRHPGTKFSVLNSGERLSRTGASRR